MRKSYLVLVAVFLLCISQALGAAYLKFDGIDGESQDKDHKDWSDILSFSQGISRSSSDGPQAARSRSSATLGDIVILKEFDKASPKIAEAVLTGKLFPAVEFELTFPSGDGARIPYLTYELKNVQVSSYNVGGSADGVPTESLSLNFEEIKVTYTQVDNSGRSAGNVSYTWKVEESRR